MRLPAVFRSARGVPAEALRRARTSAGLQRREKVLAAAPAHDGTWLLGTRDALVLLPPPPADPALVRHDPAVVSADPARIPWQCVETAEWDSDQQRLVVTEVGEFGKVRPRHVFGLDEPGLLLQLVRERVTASVVLQRRVTVHGRRGLNVVARRAPRGDGPITWAYEFDRGVDPSDPAVMAAAERALAAAQQELGPRG